MPTRPPEPDLVDSTAYRTCSRSQLYPEAKVKLHGYNRAKRVRMSELYRGESAWFAAPLGLRGSKQPHII